MNINEYYKEKVKQENTSSSSFKTETIYKDIVQVLLEHRFQENEIRQDPVSYGDYDDYYNNLLQAQKAIRTWANETEDHEQS